MPYVYVWLPWSGLWNAATTLDVLLDLVVEVVQEPQGLLLRLLLGHVGTPITFRA